ncbi:MULTISPECIES: tRNA (adenosine(37)-N6)-threonylcarbamoyltransferase complex dimerization subunit type 1 TsaB [Amylolactobacillus]|uniref:tRNA (Adenosine(37)-N6)-threonylcarbamoyltransferase complex dimerization subunit type 1 TsaB n=1 Tax=Amylolactobacillus amylophilus DSM 20533 = JCM 1125 TaxID=1423721 RepID=A0A1L6XAV3_9LACO|nr:MULTISPECIES: tRNA (adenosine(37)-N6)-threonylcarbamoyltransferase complex dimerization subunit type 1 TsaB [Amylolactobacillus]APT18083.1 tRNA (adenosine(37)-N6)-threonylcarbamoyltransferase complex dimerization subunit type 1 TsaB [Amylolactobacillus amylophilus DSM 20533 = JCM 1125]GED80557.1 tRNA (adenosine(37)-N6)-threonylcarbamoyltransferase complex dimerization subunit type 1 TsaB [Amylolactobacillus amylophilus]
MKTLSISTATENLSVAVNNGIETLAERNIVDQRNHSVNIIPTIEAVLAQSNLKLTEIEQIAVAAGPGSYTGLRIGITTAKVMGERLGVKLVGVSTLAALAANMTPAGTKAELTVALLDARNDNFFAGAYRLDSASKSSGPAVVLSDAHVALEHLLELVQEMLRQYNFTRVNFVGDFTPEHAAKIKDQLLSTDVELHFGTDQENLVHAGQIGWIAEFSTPVSPAELLPRYLRKTQAEVEWENRTGAKSLKDDSKYVEEV